MARPGLVAGTEQGRLGIIVGHWGSGFQPLKLFGAAGPITAAQPNAASVGDVMGARRREVPNANCSK
jgi:hypothetical protein